MKSLKQFFKVLSKMNPKQYKQLSRQFLENFTGASFVNNDGILLASVDQSNEKLTTTRLVAFQIIKKYLAPKPLDLFIMNDPDNGGYNFSKIIFVTALDPDLYLIWNENCPVIDFKIPPTPIYEKNKKNQFVWSALVEAHPLAHILGAFFEKQKLLVDNLSQHRELIQQLSTTKFQNIWLKSTQDIFDQQLQNKAFGSFECSYKTKNMQLIKLKLTAEDRQTVRLLQLDFSNTSPASDYHAASHVIESGLIHQIIRFYEVSDFLNQAILDKIRITLPPKSIVSKSHSLGEHNQEIQSICGQLCLHNLQQLNSQSRKVASQFEVDPEVHIEFLHPEQSSTFSFYQKNLSIGGFEDLIEKKLIDLEKMQKTDQQLHVRFRVLTNSPQSLKIKTHLIVNDKDSISKINNQALGKGIYPLQQNDVIEMKFIL